MNGIRHIRPVSPAAASGLVARVYDQARRDFNVAPPIVLHSPVPDLLAGMWCVLRESVIAGRVPRALKEALAAGVSRLNRCPFCIDAHTLMLAAAGQQAAAAAIAAGREEEVEDDATRRLLAWAAAHRSPGSPELAPPFPPPLSSDNTAEMIGTALAFHYINRAAHVFLPETPYPLQVGNGWAKGLLRRGASRVFARSVTRSYTPGDSLALLPDVELPPDLPWAAADPVIAGTYARFAASVDAAVQGALPDAVRDLVVARLTAWDGADPGLGMGWLEEAVADLSKEDRPAGRLALLTAFASYRVDDSTVAAYRTRYPEDRQLVGAACWASYVAARQVGLWLWEAAYTPHHPLGDAG
ncbi:MAG TPA: carboxymuconolactone decarboxylase family protein [Thermoanaerobaculia bacterium]|nr:carboxymuconolactone decarboxylase family protein [Thermoanaerobaculia bacterium]